MDRKKAFASLLKYSGLLYGLRKFANSGILRIIMYHRIVDGKDSAPYYLSGIQPFVFESQMKFLSENFSVISLEETSENIMADRQIPRNAVAVTIDDGYIDCYANAYPVLRKYGIPATIFLATGHMGSSKAFWIDKVGYLFKNGRPAKPYYEHPVFSRIELNTAEKRIGFLEPVVQKLKKISENEKSAIIDDLEDFFQVSDGELRVNYNLTWPQIREMSRNGVSFGTHTVTHPILTRIPIDKAEKEIVESKKRIENEIGKPVYGFCYPNGTEADFDDSIIRILKKHGFNYAVTTIWGSNDVNSDLFRLKRMEPNFNSDLANFECLLSGGFELAGKLRSKLRV